MTANEMREEFDIKLDIISSNSTPGLTDEEVSTMLTNAELNLVKKYLPPKGAVDTAELFRKELAPLYVNATLSESAEQTGVYTSKNGIYWAIPSDHYYTLNLNALMSSSTDCLNGIEINVKPVTYDEYNTNISNPFKNPDKGTVWALQSSPESNGTTERIQTLHSNDFTDITSIRISYIKKPEGITVDVSTPANQVSSLLPSIVHQEIVDEAVELAKLQLGLLNEYQAQNVYNEENK